MEHVINLNKQRKTEISRELLEYLDNFLDHYLEKYIQNIEYQTINVAVVEAYNDEGRIYPELSFKFYKNGNRDWEIEEDVFNDLNKYFNLDSGLDYDEQDNDYQEIFRLIAGNYKRDYYSVD